jgi:hypothetical protein
LSLVWPNRRLPVRWCYFRDAEGNVFEIKERTEQPAHQDPR